MILQIAADARLVGDHRDAVLTQQPRWSARLSYLGGVKRYWVTPAGEEDGPGEVAVNSLSLSTVRRVSESVSVSGTATAKLKNVNRVPGQEGYLRGTAAAGLGIRLRPVLDHRRGR